MRPGSEEYADSEKYQFRQWDWDRPGHIKELVARVNAIRHREAALQFDDTLRFHETDNPRDHRVQQDRAGRAGIEPRRSRSSSSSTSIRTTCSTASCACPLERGGRRRTAVRDLLDDETVYTWRGEWNYVRFDPDVRQGHMLKLGIGSGIKNLGCIDAPTWSVPADAAAAAPARHDDDPLWYKDAIIYQAHVKAFFDSNERRHRRLPGPDPEARLPPEPRHHLPLAAALLPLAAQGRRLRHRRLPERPSAATARSTTSRRSCAPRTSGASRC